jgi:hypothetical protein
MSSQYLNPICEQIFKSIVYNDYRYTLIGYCVMGSQRDRTFNPTPDESA